MRHTTILLIALALASCLFSYAQVPNKISYQGLLTTSLGTPVPDGSYSIKFDIYNLPTGGTLRHSETHSTVGIARGAFSVLLGPLPAIFNESLYVEVTTLSGPGILVPTTFSPRSELASAPYSLAPWMTDSSNIYYNSGNVGIGTTNPVSKLQVNDGPLRIEYSAGGNQLDANGIWFHARDVYPSSGATGAGIWYGNVAALDFNSYLAFKLYRMWETYEVMRLMNGNVGIGTTSPTAKLHIGGTPGIDGIRFPDGTTQTTAAVSGGSGWSLLGNAGTFDGTNFIGTTDSVPFNIRVNNLRSGYINNTYGLAFFGYQAGSLNVIGATSNSAFGNGALQNNTLASQNVAIGGEALFTQTFSNAGTAWATNNVAVGYQALYSNQPTTIADGGNNTAIGNWAMRSNITGDHKTACGVNALFSNTTGSDNTASGAAALYSNTTGQFNTASGLFSLFLVNTQNSNSAMGFSAGDFYTMTQGTFCGDNCYPNASGYTNVSGFGYNARPTASNSVQIGNSFVTSIGGYAGWTNLSDARFKRNVQENVKGLEFITKLRPVTYNLDAWKLAHTMQEDRTRDKDGNITTVQPEEATTKARNEKSAIVQTGFIAQEVEKAAREVGYDFSGVDAPKNENDFYGLRYAEFVVPLVKAVQELNEQNREQRMEIEELKRDIGQLKNRR